ncbi:hypothetical protein BKA63DRAFT_118434 [Paraphoma chrysanthemicola]|nr:hypothetical protein BKA63DRAFT_118434 [Paraphoma chrysanthemicola]
MKIYPPFSFPSSLNYTLPTCAHEVSHISIDIDHTSMPPLNLSLPIFQIPPFYNCILPNVTPPNLSPYPLRLNHPHSSTHTSNLYAYPTQLPPNTIIYLQTYIPAIISYVLGQAWQPSAHTNPYETLLVPQPPAANWTDANESALGLRMLRSGGAIMNISFTPTLAWRFDEMESLSWLPVAQR